LTGAALAVSAFRSTVTAGGVVTGRAAGGFETVRGSTGGKDSTLTLALADAGLGFSSGRTTATGGATGGELGFSTGRDGA
jgi:hypothetical protein